MACNLLPAAEDAYFDGVKYMVRTMVTEQSIPQSAAAKDGSRDLLSKRYRKIGISAVLAALEVAKPLRDRKDLPSLLPHD
jgi:hypothetical protein